MQLKTGFCTCCGSSQTVNVRSEIENYTSDLAKYFDFKRLNLNTCSNCGFVAEDITTFFGLGVFPIVQSKEYRELLDNSYMDGYKDLPEQDYQKVSVGQFEAYVLLCKEENKLLDLAKALAYISDIKRMLSSTYNENKYDYDYDEYQERYDEISEKLFNEAQKANAECIEVLKQVNIEPNYYFDVFVAERYAIAEKYKHAKNIIDRVYQNTNFDDEMKNYINEFLTEVEKLWIS